MKKPITLLLPVFFFIISCNSTTENNDATEFSLSDAEREEIMTTFNATQDAWNSGDLVEFMKGYWESDRLVFAGAGGPTYGYKKTLERYKYNYPDTATMGILKFTVIDLEKIDHNTALMIGRFNLSRTMGNVVGYYTLVWQQKDGRWLIISDHSSGQSY